MSVDSKTFRVPFLEEIAAANPLQELIACAIFEYRYKKNWSQAKENDQWLAYGTWQDAEAVMKVLPLAVSNQ